MPRDFDPHESSLLSELSVEQVTSLTRCMVAQRLYPHQVLREAGDELIDVYFIESGVVSLLSGPDGAACETALVGREGMIGACTLLGETVAPSTAIVRAAGIAWRIPRRDLVGAVEADLDLHRRLLRYVNRRMAGAARAVLVASRCTITQRVAGWLLMAQDRIDGDELCVTHDHIAFSLGVRRPGVTVAMHILEGEHAISSRRSRVTIRSRETLVQYAGAAYQTSPPAPAHRLNKRPEHATYTHLSPAPAAG